MLMNIAYIVIGIIINITVLSVGMRLIFPKLSKMRKIQNRLDVNKISVPITTGKCNFGSSETVINTSNPDKSSFVWIPDSNNLKGGVQFTYTFWLNMKAATPLDNKILFSRGSMVQGSEGGYLSKCPMVEILKDGNSRPTIRLSFNTLSTLDNVIDLSEDIFSLIVSTSANPRWFLISLSFRDYVDFSNSEHGVQVQAFINDNLVKTEIKKNDSLKLNHGNIIITPSSGTGDQSSFYSDITYHNFAMDIMDIQEVYELGVSKASGCVTAKDSASDVVQNAYQRLSMHNNLNQI